MIYLFIYDDDFRWTSTKPGSWRRRSRSCRSSPRIWRFFSKSSKKKLKKKLKKLTEDLKVFLENSKNLGSFKTLISMINICDFCYWDEYNDSGVSRWEWRESSTAGGKPKDPQWDPSKSSKVFPADFFPKTMHNAEIVMGRWD